MVLDRVPYDITLLLRQGDFSCSLENVKRKENFSCVACSNNSELFVEYSCKHTLCLSCFATINTHLINQIVSGKEPSHRFMQDSEGYTVLGCTQCVTLDRHRMPGVCSFYTYRLLPREAYEELKNMAFERTRKQMRDDDSKVQ